MPYSWLDALQRVRAIAQTGLTYGRDEYDLERYRELTAIAEHALAELLRVSPELVAERYVLEKGYPTPKVDVRTAVFSEDRVLLVRESADNLWTMPGGWADETDSPRQAAEREVEEESGYRVKVTRLISLKDRRAHDYQPKMLGGCYKIFFLADLLGGSPATSLETSAVDFFALDRLPPLSVGRTLREDVEQAYAAHRDPTTPIVID
ncbi:MAG TPA: NUDIX hydrolase [Polyangiaceae bacterium]